MFSGGFEVHLGKVVSAYEACTLDRSMSVTVRRTVVSHLKPRVSQSRWESPTVTGAILQLVFWFLGRGQAL